MRKVWMGLLWVGMWLGGGASAQVGASDEQLLRYFLKHHLPPSATQDQGAALTAEARQFLSRAAAEQPARHAAVFLFFHHPQAAARVQEMWDRQPVLLFELGIAWSANGAPRVPGKLYERSIARHTGDLASRIAGALREERAWPADEFRVIELSVVEVGLIADLRTLQRLAAMDDVAAVVLVESQAFVARHEQDQRCYARYGVPPTVSTRLVNQRSRPGFRPYLIEGHPCDRRIAGNDQHGNPDASLQALQAFLGSSDAGLIADRLATASKQIEVGAVRAPRERRVAQVLLREGLRGQGVQSLLERYRLGLLSFEAKAPLSGAVDHFVTLTTPATALPPSRTLAERVDGALDLDHGAFLEHGHRLAGDAGQSSLAAEFRATAAQRRLSVYRLEVSGTREDLRSLAASSVVRAVFVVEGPRAREAP
jgi:hypothetical protein